MIVAHTHWKERTSWKPKGMRKSWARNRRAVMDKVRCGVIGVGGMGSGHCRMMGQIPEVELTAVCDINPEACRSVAEKYEVRGFEGYEELLDSGLVDMVIVATSHYFHTPITEAAF